MKVIVLGAGVIGVTTAYYLAKSGYEVEVIEMSENVGEGCSYANGGQLSYSHIEPWSKKSSIFSLIKGSFNPYSHTTINDFNNKEFYRWIYNFLKNSSNEKLLKISKNIFKISNNSKHLMEDLLKEEVEFENGDKFNLKNSGILHFYRNKKLFDEDYNRLEKFHNSAIKFHAFDSEETIKIEPCLEKLYNQKNLYGSIYFPADKSGDCNKFVNILASICKKKYGVKFHFKHHIKNLFTNYEKITGINTDKKVFYADRYIYCLGAGSLNLLNGIKIQHGIYPVKGYSLSIECDNQDFLAPNISLTDNQNKIVYSRIGNIFRVAGTVEIGKFDAKISKKNLNFLHKNIKECFSGYGDISKVKEWSSFRPYRFNSTPLIGVVNGLENLYLNVGHGSLGWTNSLASANIIASEIKGNHQKDFNFLIDDLKHIFKV